jgi:tRNA pseudouridine38-40 synthase
VSDGPGGGPRRRALRLAYDGTRYAGWQVQPGLPTVQGELETALARLCGAPVRVTGSGRTDAGVHALGQVAHFDDPRGLPLGRLLAGLQAWLPDDIRVLGAADVAPDFHARHHARDKTYVYQLHLPGGRSQPAGRRSLPPHRRLTFHAAGQALDVSAMRRAAAQLVGTRDFGALSKRMDDDRTTVRTLHAVRVLRVPHGLRLFATADGFLYGMVRLLAGLLLEVGRGRRAPDDVPALLASRDRSRAPPSLPAHGLCLWRVRYGRPGDGAGSRLIC